MKRMTALIVGLTVASSLVLASAASAAPVNDCHYGIGGAYLNLTTRVISCREARGFNGVAFRILNLVSTRVRFRHDGHFRTGRWDVRAHWYHSRYTHIDGSNDQLDVRATASGGRVVRFQTAWD